MIKNPTIRFWKQKKENLDSHKEASETGQEFLADSKVTRELQSVDESYENNEFEGLEKMA